MSQWKIRRGDAEFAAPDDATLTSWVREGKVVPSDYIFNPTLQRWMYASEVGEIAGDFTAKSVARRSGGVNRVGLLLLLGGGAVFLLADGPAMKLSGVLIGAVGFLVLLIGFFVGLGR